MAGQMSKLTKNQTFCTCTVGWFKNSKFLQLCEQAQAYLSTLAVHTDLTLNKASMMSILLGTETEDTVDYSRCPLHSTAVLQTLCRQSELLVSATTLD